LYPGVMLTAEGPKIFELNVRFGDPETQVYLPRLESDLLELVDASTSGTLATDALAWRDESVLGVVVASKGYPGAYEKGLPIRGLDGADGERVKVFHSGTEERDGQLVTNGGRVLCVTAWAPELVGARDAAYAAAAGIDFDGCFSRSDIGAKALT
jgi:phosphoribosylamine--glycine ligase